MSLLELVPQRVPAAPGLFPLAASDAAPADAERLIPHIVERYHDTHRREFPVAIRLARKVEAVHAGDPDCPAGLADLLSVMADELEAHQQREERALFPMLLSRGCSIVRVPIVRMMAEHVEVEQQLVELARLTRNFTAPEDACHTWRELCRACRKISDDLGEHMRLENEVLFAPILE